ncbi:YhhA family cyclophane-containing RiPP [Moraxella oblonga]|uniref:YhhA family cyclophane-containing RiPP n=1 Tax=Moraxella oblonga TaxID=200413 RepID=UPI000B32A678
MQTTTLPKANISNGLQGVKNHPLLTRLIKEISDDKIHLMCPHTRYDRTHNRHNRGQ